MQAGPLTSILNPRELRLDEERVRQRDRILVGEPVRRGRFLRRFQAARHQGQAVPPVRLVLLSVDKQRLPHPEQGTLRYLEITERFLGILIEHYAGAFPVWLAPVQVIVLSVAERHADYAAKLVQDLVDAGLRAEADVSNESVGKKIRNAERMKVPYALVVGDKEAGGGELTVRRRGEKEQTSLSKDAFVSHVMKEDKERVTFQ